MEDCPANPEPSEGSNGKILKSKGSEWALILGASNGFGEAVGLELARSGMNIFGVHFDRKSTLPHVEEVIQGIRDTGREVEFFNLNAADAEKRSTALDRMAELIGKSGTIRVLLHSLAFGTLKLFIGETEKEEVSQSQMDMTLDVMAHSLVYWTQDVVHRGLMKEGGRVYAMTSAGGTRVLPSYGPVSSAKAALESHIRQLAMEMAPRKITANAIRAGVTDTPALRKIPGNDLLIDAAKARNPYGRLTTPEDVAKAISVLCHENTYWLTGNVLGVDGGEDIVG